MYHIKLALDKLVCFPPVNLFMQFNSQFQMKNIKKIEAKFPIVLSHCAWGD
jgi:hypothetical protein